MSEAERVDREVEQIENVHGTEQVNPKKRPQMDRSDFRRAIDIAKAFHYSYSLFAPALGWTEQEGTSVAWEDLPEANRNLMLVVAVDLLNRGLVR